MCHGPVAWFMLLYALVSRGSERLPTASVQHGLQKKIKKVKKRDPTTGKDQKKKHPQSRGKISRPYSPH